MASPQIVAPEAQLVAETLRADPRILAVSISGYVFEGHNANDVCSKLAYGACCCAQYLPPYHKTSVAYNGFRCVVHNHPAAGFVSAVVAQGGPINKSINRFMRKALRKAYGDPEIIEETDNE